MHPVEAFVRNPVKVWVAMLLITLFGIVAWFRMPMQLTPEVQIPTISIETRWPGASPQEVEREIVQEQEEQLKAVEGVIKMSSSASDSSARIDLEFAVGTNISEALLRVNSRLQQVPEYPEDADEPVISTSSSSNSPIAWFMLSTRLPDRAVFEAYAQSHPELEGEIQDIMQADNPGIADFRTRRLVAAHPDAQHLLPPPLDIPMWRKYAENVIESTFERVPGVSNANVLGGVDPELQVVVDPELLAARHVSIEDLRRALRLQNTDTSAGDLWEGKRRWVVRTISQFRSPEQVGNQVLAVNDGAPVYVKDVARVEQAFKKPDGFVRRFGTRGIAVNVVRETGANVLDVMAGLRTANERLNESVLKERGLLLTQVYDETEYIHDALGLVRENIFSGSALTMISLMLFLHLGRRSMAFSPFIALTSFLSLTVSPWFFAITAGLIIVSGVWFARGALVIGLAIPICIVGTFLALQMLGMSLNVISLAGLAFAVGIVVDNATVVLENIYRHYQMGETAEVAAIEATKEVWGAVLLSTLTNLAVFVPVFFVQDEAGQLFRDISLAIAASTGLSLFVAVVLIPPVAARLLGTGADLGNFESDNQTGADRNDRNGDRHNGNGHNGHAGRRHRSATVRWLAYSGRWFVEGTVAMNRWIQATTARRIATAGILTGASILLTWVIWPKVEYLPAGNRNLVIGLIQPPPGYNLEELDRLGEVVEDHLRPYWDLDPNSPAARELEFPAIADFFYVARGSQVFIGIRAHDRTAARKLIPLIFQLTPKMPGSFAVAFQTSLFSRGLAAGRSIDIEISGPELQQLVQYGGQIMSQVGNVLEPNVEIPLRLTQAQPVPSLDLSSPEVHVVPRLESAAELGVTASELGYSVNALVDGAYAADYFVGKNASGKTGTGSAGDEAYAYIGGEKIDLSIVGPKKSVVNTQDIGSLPVATPSGQFVSLDSIADVRLSSGPEQINHRERERTITVRVTPPPAMAVEEALRRIETEIIGPMRTSGQLRADYLVNLSGAADKLRSTWSALRGNVILAALITYLLMAGMFESWTHPLVIILTVPLGAVGGVLGLWLLNGWLIVLGQGDQPQSLDVLTMLGFVILIGTVVNNPILIVHQALNHMRADGMSHREAVLESVRNRIRPIFITTLTTVVGLIPLVMFPGAGSELYRGLGAVVLGGITLSTIFTLVQIPALFTLLIDLQHVIRRWRSRWSPPTERRPRVKAGTDLALPAELPGNGSHAEPAHAGSADEVT